MKVTSESDKLAKLSSLMSSKNPISIVLENFFFRASSDAKVTEVSTEKLVFSLSGGGVIILKWFSDSECESMSLPAKAPDAHHLDFNFKNGLRLLVTERIEKKAPQ
jgi:hypothetical protein